MVISLEFTEGTEQYSFASEHIDNLLSERSIIEVCNSFLKESTLRTIDKNYLYVCQGEYGIIPLQNLSSISWIGTGAATTCHAVVIYNDYMVGLTHIDSPESVIKILDTILKDVKGDSLDVYVVGGFTDEEHSKPISESLFQYVCNSDVVFTVKLWCTLELNTTVRDCKNYPICTDIVFNLSEQTIHQANFVNPGPELPLRQIMRYFGSNSRCSSVYNDNNRAFIIQQFEFKADPRYLPISRAPDWFMLQNMSTSPHCEPPEFCDMMRSTYHLLATQDTTRIFGNPAEPLVYKIDNSGMWVKQ